MVAMYIALQTDVWISDKRQYGEPLRIRLTRERGLHQLFMPSGGHHKRNKVPWEMLFLKIKAERGADTDDSKS